MDLTSSNLQATNEKFNKVLSNLESTKADALANLETAASTATSAISSQLANVDGDLRSLVPEGFSVPNINLQGQLQSLSGLTDVTQSANLLASITADFGDALSASGFSLDTLVSDAASAFGSGDSLSGLIPNFERSPLGDVIQKASAVKLPSIDPVVEKASTFTQNTEVTAAKTAAASSVRETSKTLPTEDGDTYKVAKKSKKVTQSYGGVAHTKEVTTSSQAVEVKTSGGEVKVIRSNITEKGFSHQTGTKFIKASWDGDITGSQVQGEEIEIELPNNFVKIERVQGFTQEGQPIQLLRSGRVKNRTRFFIKPYGFEYQDSSPFSGQMLDTWSLDTTNPDKTLLIIKQDFRTYDRETKDGKSVHAIFVKYKYNKNYDPTYKQESSAGLLV